MKKVLVAVVLMMGIGSFSAFAAETSVDSVVIACEVNQDDFVKVEVKDLPGVVTQSIEKSYPDSVIQEVYVAEKTEGKLFKVILVIEGKEAIAIFNEKGEEKMCIRDRRYPTNWDFHIRNISAVGSRKWLGLHLMNIDKIETIRHLNHGS